MTLWSIVYYLSIVGLLLSSLYILDDSGYIPLIRSLSFWTLVSFYLLYRFASSKQPKKLNKELASRPELWRRQMFKSTKLKYKFVCWNDKGVKDVLHFKKTRIKVDQTSQQTNLQVDKKQQDKKPIDKTVEQHDEHQDKTVDKSNEHKIFDKEDEQKQQITKDKIVDRPDEEKSTNDKTVMCKPYVFVLDWNATNEQDDTNSKSEQSKLIDLSEKITLILQLVDKNRGDRIVLLLNSPGGAVEYYGLASAELLRINQAQIPLTVCVDMMAASGGYLMSAMADHIVAAPFAWIGSIGVRCALTNFSSALKKLGVQYLEFSAGQHKTGISTLGPVDSDKLEKQKTDLKRIHDVFKTELFYYRPKLLESKNIDALTSGDTWLAKQAIELNLIDEIDTSSSYLNKLCATHTVVQVINHSIDHGNSWYSSLLSSIKYFAPSSMIYNNNNKSSDYQMHY